MELSAEERKILESLVAPRTAARRLVAGLLAILGVAMIALQIWGIWLEIERAAVYDSLLASGAEVLAEGAPFRSAALRSLKIATSIFVIAVGWGMVCTAVILLLKNRAHRAIEVLARRLLAES